MYTCIYIYIYIGRERDIDVYIYNIPMWDGGGQPPGEACALNINGCVPRRSNSKSNSNNNNNNTVNNKTSHTNNIYNTNNHNNTNSSTDAGTSRPSLCTEPKRPRPKTCHSLPTSEIGRGPVGCCCKLGREIPTSQNWLKVEHECQGACGRVPRGPRASRTVSTHA